MQIHQIAAGNACQLHIENNRDRARSYFDSFSHVLKMEIALNRIDYSLVGPNQTTDVSGSAPVVFALEGVRPNPARGGTMVVWFALPSASPATLELLDLAGRRVVERAVGTLGPGRHAVDLAPARGVSAGMYFLRLTQGPNTRVVRFAVLN